jgi:hypothetical protein
MPRFLWPLLVVWCACLLPSAAWAQGVGSFVSPGPLASDHAHLDSLTTCTSCHAPGMGPTPARCMVCHESVKEQVDSGSGFHADKGRTCEKCHPDHRGRNFQLIRFEENDFDHSKTGFPLEGAHAETRCIECHKTPNVYTGLSSECKSCHDEPHGGKNSTRDLIPNCESCHGVKNWKVAEIAKEVFDHESKADADYLLVGLHRDVDCLACHVDALFVPVESEQCVDCHVNPHRASFKDRACEDCHETPHTWEVEKFDHDLTRYRIEGKHVGVGCGECHKADKTEPVPFADCAPCHADVHKGQFAPEPCRECHNVNGFSMRDFDHDTTEFPLKGKHRENQCEQCHGQGNLAKYVGVAHADCDDCHEDVHQGRFQPTKCAACHIEDGFEVQAFDHDATSFPHTGKHVGLDCNKCHRDFQWNGIPHSSCVDCHYTKNPHRPVITPDTCGECHTTDSFQQINFDHAAKTEFDLSPQHVETKCTDCHTRIYQFDGLQQGCTDCHEDERPFGHFAGACGDCHQAAGWFPGELGDQDHAITGFPLMASHSLLPCESCHPPGRPRGAALPACSGCHWDDDPHQNMLGANCQDCHNEFDWLRTSFRHTTTGWPLRGAHKLAACSDCHAAGYIGTPTECWRCHAAQADPAIRAHQTGSVQSCDYCHRPYTWDVARFPH